jgi:hypothetical protein
MTTHSPKELADEAIAAVLAALDGPEQAIVVDSPPGAGKSTLVVRAALTLAAGSEPCIIVAQTNDQVDDLILRLAGEAPHLNIGRLTSQSYQPPDHITGLPNVIVAQKSDELGDCRIIVATAKKWATVDGTRWRWAIIDEAYQMRSDALLLLGKLFDRALFVGDPGQLDPFSIVQTPRWIGLPHDPMNSAVSVLLNHNPAAIHTLPVSWRLPTSAATIISRAFYPFTPFQAGTAPGTRTLTFTATGMRTAIDNTLDVAARTGWAMYELPPRHTTRTDPEAAQATVDLADKLLLRQAQAHCEIHPDGRALEPRDIAIGTAHRDQARHIQHLLDHNPRTRGIRADTANRLQGREFAVTIVLHPLSGRRDASAFHLEAGRMCVLTSRHRHACIVVTRAGITDLLDTHPSNDPIHLRVPAKFPDGWEAHQHLMDHLDAYRVRAA